jgi:hypothetical protein
MRRDGAFPETIASGTPPAEIVVATAARFSGLSAYGSAGALMYVKGYSSRRGNKAPRPAEAQRTPGAPVPQPACLG